MKLLAIDGTVITIVSDYTVNTRDIEAESGGESETGYTVVDVVREGVYSIGVKLTGNLVKIKEVLALVSKPSFIVLFLSPLTGTMCEAIMHKNSTSSSLLVLNNDNGYWETSFTLEEF